MEGFKLTQQEWVSLNRVRTDYGRCGFYMYQWNLRNNPACDCGNAIHTIQHIMTDCPKRRFVGEMNDFFRLTNQALD
jgi:hypothetical protein